MTSSSNGMIRLVAVFKLLKAALLIVAGIGILKLMHTDVAGELYRWIVMLGLDPGSRYVNDAIQKVTDLSPDKIKELGLGSFLYAALFLTEGIGLWLLKHWAEWFTVISTSSLVPLEIYEIHRRPTAIRIIVLVINLAVVGYLLYRIRQESHDARARRPAFYLPRCVVVPAQDTEGAQRVPPACPADARLHLQWNMFGMQEVERPAPVLVAARPHDFDGVADAAVGLDSCMAQIIESAQDVVVPKRRE